MITLKLKIGKGMLEFQANTMQEIHQWSEIWGALPDKCTCGSDNIYLSFMKTQEGYEYLKLKCKDCGATYTIKKNKKNEYFIDPSEKFVKFQKGQSSNTSKDDNVPF